MEPQTAPVHKSATRVLGYQIHRAQMMSDEPIHHSPIIIDSDFPALITASSTPRGRIMWAALILDPTKTHHIHHDTPISVPCYVGITPTKPPMI
jgi:hypothetical protein